MSGKRAKAQRRGQGVSGNPAKRATSSTPASVIIDSSVTPTPSGHLDSLNDVSPQIKHLRATIAAETDLEALTYALHETAERHTKNPGNWSDTDKKILIHNSGIGFISNTTAPAEVIIGANIIIRDEFGPNADGFTQSINSSWSYLGKLKATHTFLGPAKFKNPTTLLTATKEQLVTTLATIIKTSTNRDYLKTLKEYAESYVKPLNAINYSEIENALNSNV